MTKRLITSLLFLVITATSFAQIVTITGSVNDQKTGSAIPGASVLVGKAAATSTNSAGQFQLVLNKSDAVQSGITIRCIGYQAKHLAYREGEIYNLKLQPAINTMHEVEILSPAESIMEKAIRKIPQNYSNKDFNMKGILRIQEISKDTAGTYLYYNNDAALNVYYPSYLKSADIEVSLIQNKFSRLKNASHDMDSVRWVGGYLTIVHHDFVHNRAPFITKSGLKRFTYTNQGKSYVNGTRVYVINFYSKEFTGTLYIDTARYAFVSAHYTHYNVKNLLFITQDRVTTSVNYKQTDGKWYIDNIKSVHAAKLRGLSLDYSFNYKTIGMDTTKVQLIPYHDKLQLMDENIKTNKLGTDADWLPYKKLFEQNEQDSIIAKNPVPKVDTTLKQPKGTKILSNIFGYLVNDNIRYNIQIAKLPFSFDGYQPALSKNIDASAAYTLSIGMQFRLYKNLFVEAADQTNYGLGGIRNDVVDYLLSYNFEVNKKYHPITLSPVFGFDKITLRDHSTEYLNQKSLVYGINGAYEIKKKLGYLISIKYMDPVNTYNNGLLLNKQQLFIGLGIVWKL